MVCISHPFHQYPHQNICRRHYQFLSPGEQLKRKNVVELVDESPAPLLGSSKNTCGPKKADLWKNPIYINTRMDEVYPVRKNSIRLRMLPRKENAKEHTAEHTGILKSPFVPSDFAAKGQPKFSCSRTDSLALTVVSKEDLSQACKSTEKCCENTFLNVKELSLGGGKFSGVETVDLIAGGAPYYGPGPHPMMPYGMPPVSGMGQPGGNYYTPY